MRAALTMLSGAVAAPPPLPFRPPKRDGDMPWAEAVDRHRHRLATVRAALRTPWDAGRVAEAVAAATARLLALQAEHLDVLDAGRLDEDESVRAAARLLRGFEFESGLDDPLEWIPDAAPPRLVAPPVLHDVRALRRRWEAAQKQVAKPVKLSLLGPRSFAGAVDDALYGGDVDAGAHALAEALNPGLRQLGEAGCPAIELVEPAFLTATPAVTTTGFEAIARALHKVPRETRRWLRLVPADTQPPWLGPPPPRLNLATIAPILADLPIDGIVLEPEVVLTAPDNPGRLRKLLVALLVVPAEADSGFRADDARDPLVRASAVMEPGRLVAAVDGGGARAREPLVDRLELLSAAARVLAPDR